MEQRMAHVDEPGAPGGGAAPASLEDHDRRLAAEPDNAGLHAEKISLLRNLGRHEEALEACDRAISIHPGEASFLARKAHILHGLGRHAEALVELERALELCAEDPSIHTNMAATLICLGRHEEALESCRRAIAIDPGRVGPHKNSAVALSLLGRHSQAVGACGVAISISPEDADMRAIMAEELAALGYDGRPAQALPGGSAPHETTAPPSQKTQHIAAEGGAAEARRARRRAEAAELAGFMDYLMDRGIVKDTLRVDTVEGCRLLQKYSYIAQSLGMGIGYEFGFINSGAFSTELAVDAYRYKTADCGTVPFRPEGRLSDVFVRMVQGREPEWLQVATFAVRGHGKDGALDAFVRAKYERMDYDEELIREVFGEVDAIMASMGRAGK